MADPRLRKLSGMEEYSDLDMQQMIGRAGRPQYDTHGQVVVSKRRDHVEVLVIDFRSLTDNVREAT